MLLSSVYASDYTRAPAALSRSLIILHVFFYVNLFDRWNLYGIIIYNYNQSVRHTGNSASIITRLFELPGDFLFNHICSIYTKGEAMKTECTLYKCILDSDNLLINTGKAYRFEEIQELGVGSGCAGYAAKCGGRPYVLKKHLAFSSVIGADDFIQVYTDQKKLNGILTNTFSWIENLYTDSPDGISSVYYAVKGSRGISMREYMDGPAPLWDKINCLLTLCGIIENLAKNDLFFYDLKPENCLVIEENGLSLEIFDTDSIVSMSRPNPDRIRISPDWIDRNFYLSQKPTECMSVYTLGAFLYEIIFTPKYRTGIEDLSTALYPFSRSPYKDQLDFELKSMISSLLRQSYCVLQKDRLQTVKEFSHRLKEIHALLTEEHRQLLNSSVPRMFTRCIGREKDEEQIFSMLSAPGGGNLFFLNGMGGMGKSSLVCDLAQKYGDRLGFYYTFYSNSLYDTVLNLNFGVPVPDELHREEHYSWILDRLNSYKNSVLIIDNCDLPDPFTSPFSGFGKHDVLSDLSRLNMKFLFVSRYDMSRCIDNKQVYELQALNPESCREIFTKKDIEINDAKLNELLSLTKSNTLLLSLIAGTIKDSYNLISLDAILSAMKRAELKTEISTETYSTYHSSNVMPQSATISGLLEQLFNISQFSPQLCSILSFAALLPVEGIDFRLFSELAENKTEVIKLINCGWLQLTESENIRQRILLHPVIALMVRENPRTLPLWEHVQNMVRKLEAYKLTEEKSWGKIDGVPYQSNFTEGSYEASQMRVRIQEQVKFVPYIDATLLDDFISRISSGSYRYENGDAKREEILSSAANGKYGKEDETQPIGEENELRIQDGCTEIEPLEYECSKAKRLIIPASVKKIGYGAFFASRFERVDIYGCPDIDDLAFRNCSDLRTVNFHASQTDEEHYIGVSAFAYCKALKHISLPSWITEIKSYAFSFSGLERISLPYVEVLGDAVFWDCKSLTFAELCPCITEIPVSLFINCQSLIRVKTGKLREIGDFCFAGCKSLKNIGEFDFSEGICLEYVEMIGFSAFCRSGITRVSAPKVVEIGTGCFSRCNELSTVYCPNLEKLGFISSFINCVKLEKVTISPKCFIIPKFCFAGCTSLRSVSSDEAGTAKLNNITHIGDHAFRDCTELQSVIMPKAEKVFEKAFMGCKKLQNVHFGNLKEAGMLSFAETGISELILPESTQKLDAMCFKNCKNLKSVIFPSHPMTIIKSAFSGCDAVEHTENCPDLFLFSDSPVIHAQALRDLIRKAAFTEDNELREKLQSDLEDIFKSSPEFTTERFYNLAYYYAQGILRKRKKQTEMIKELQSYILTQAPECLPDAGEGIALFLEDAGNVSAAGYIRKLFREL